MEESQDTRDLNGDERPPPRDFLRTLKYLGPGLIVSASIVGSGELIAATTLGARVGLAALWLIILSCVIKVVIQEELGRYSISSGETTFRALDKIPGPRWGTSWVIWCYMLMFVGVAIQQGGILGGVGQVFNLALPQLSVQTWTMIMAALLAVLLLWGGHYSRIEKTCIFMVVSFTFITIACVVLLYWTPYRISLQDMVEGFRFHLPTGGLAVAFAVFGITGVGATELIFYPYWCLEKGYARFVGPKAGSPDWLDRAHGWIRVMKIDTIVAMLVYTLATVAFYILGARVLYGMGKVPAGYEMVHTLSNMYTEILGPWASYLFLLGGFFVLYSTMFSATASNSRVFLDLLELLSLVKVRDEGQRWRWRCVIVVSLLLIYTVLHSLVGEPVLMIILGGIAQACMLPVIAFSTIYLRYKQLDPAIRPGLITDVLLWLCSTLMLAFALHFLASRLLNLF
ncbi:Nramp family divalent metal transporter [Acidobacteria bacterium AH-259-O06]|nr:Nramp family divalent metal transporter [Acidobacteria bacterium AH-259-G07]MDA2930572.1 Nramp family divalent metal transporter [Acidobacteria bacterium AH-259-O06]